MKIKKCVFEKDTSGLWITPAIGWSNINGDRTIWIGWIYWMWKIEIKNKKESIMPLFRKKPVTIEAFEFTGNNQHEIELWSAGKIYASPVLDPTPDNPTGDYLQIDTPEGTMTAIVGDWIIKGITGEFYPCKSDIFRMTYELVQP